MGGTVLNQNYSNKNIFWIKAIAHLVVLLMIFIGPELIFSIGRNVPKLMFLTPLCYIILFYLNYYWIMDKYMFTKKKVWIYVVINILLILVTVTVFYIVESSLRPPGPPTTLKPDGFIPPPMPHHGVPHHGGIEMHALRALTMLPRIGTMALLSISLSILLKLSEKWLTWENQKQRIKAELQENELKNLKNQLNPHFLFNTLNNIYALIPISQEKAQKSVHELSQLLRYTLYDNENREVPLEKELRFVKNYISLMQLRMNSYTTLNTRINENEGKGKFIAPLLFITLIENAFKHGISGNKPSFIDIFITVQDNSVNCTVRNSYFPKTDSDKSGSGIGITNLKRQLNILYPKRHSFTITKINNQYISELTIYLS
mgnify:CR=1 FL=1